MMKVEQYKGYNPDNVSKTGPYSLEQYDQFNETQAKNGKPLVPYSGFIMLRYAEQVEKGAKRLRRN